jgi:hypothetical protein
LGRSSAAIDISNRAAMCRNDSPARSARS